MRMGALMTSSTLHAATLDELGGAAEVVAQHLERAMQALDPEQQRLASELLRQLVTPSGAKIAHAPSDLAGYAGVGEDEACAVLDVLGARRILRVAECARGAPSGDHAAALSLGDLNCTGLNGQRPFRQGNIIVVALVPAPGNANAIRHRMQLFLRVRDHVAHDQPAEGGAHVVDVNRHGCAPVGSFRTA